MTGGANAKLTHVELWGKQRGLDTPYPLAGHLLDTACVARVLWREWLRPELRSLIEESTGLGNGERTAMFAAGAHDIGKASPVFQGQLRSRRPDDWICGVREDLVARGYALTPIVPRDLQKMILRRHTDGSAMTLCDGRVSPNLNADESWLPLIALGHHGEFSLDFDHTLTFEKIAGGKWEASRHDLLALLAEGCKLSPMKWRGQLPAAMNPVATTLLSGLTILADRIASQVNLVSAAQKAMRNSILHLDNPMEWIHKRTETFHQAISKTLGLYEGFAKPQESILGQFRPNQLQERAAQVEDGLWLVMAPTGYGKTEAALMRHAQKQESLTFLLPTQATTNAIMRRVQSYYLRTANVASLAHGLASLEDFYTLPLSESPDDNANGGLFPTEFVSHGSGRLLAPVTIGTIDQALMGALPLKWSHLRLLALANSHVVIDEAHTMDHYQITLIEPLMWWLGQTHARVTVLTATLPTWQRNILARAYAPNWSGQAVEFPSTQLVTGGEKTVDPISMTTYDIALTVDEALDTVQAHVAWAAQMRREAPRARLGVIVNVIDRAQDIACLLAESGEKVIVLHSRMTAEHRRINAELLETYLGPNGDGEGLTIVGTQAIEASLDIDLDALSTDLAPATSLIQRAGRAWRRSDSQRSERLPNTKQLPLHIVRGTTDDSSRPYAKALLSRTWEFLSKLHTLRAPDDFQAFVETREQRLDSVESLDDFDELAETSRKSNDARIARTELWTDLGCDANFSEFSELTKYANSKPDNDEEYPVTRWIDRDSRRVIICDHGNSRIPGAWHLGVDALAVVEPKDMVSVRRALSASVVISGKILRRLEQEFDSIPETASALLRNCLAGPLPDWLSYDLLVGLRLTNKNR